MQNSSPSKSCIVTYSGRVVDVLDPAPSSICIVDIAHALSHVNRFGGHTALPYSVAAHSCLVAQALYLDGGNDSRLALAGLLHDAAEAYIGDIVRPLKRSVPFFHTVERGLLAAIGQTFGCAIHEFSPSVDSYDDRALLTEAEHLGSRELVDRIRAEVPKATPIDVRLLPEHPFCSGSSGARGRFLKLFLKYRQGEWCPCGNCTPPHFRY